MKKIIQTDQAPQAIGPYSQAVQYGNTVYLSGQIPLDPQTMEMLSGDIAAQTRQVITNMRAVCQAAGGDLTDIVKLTVYLTDMENYAQVNEVMCEYFTPPYPARVLVAVAGLPKAAAVEMAAVMGIHP